MWTLKNSNNNNEKKPESEEKRPDLWWQRWGWWEGPWRAVQTPTPESGELPGCTARDWSQHPEGFSVKLLEQISSRGETRFVFL